MPKFIIGDILTNKWGDYRLIIGSRAIDPIYIFIEKRENADWYYNPTNACISQTAMEEKWELSSFVPKETLTHLLNTLGENIVKIEREIILNNQYLTDTLKDIPLETTTP
jgi:hypothetical protein